MNKSGAHICTVSIWANEIDIFKQPEKNKRFAQKTGKLDEKKVNLDVNAWHTAIVEVIGATVVASVDGTEIIYGSHDGLNIDMSDIDFAANGAVVIKSIEFCRAAPPADVHAAMGKLQSLRGKLPAATDAK